MMMMMMYQFDLKQFLSIVKLRKKKPHILHYLTK